jgi:hypothetical protein
MAAIDWPAAIAALDAGELPCSSGEQRILRLAASLADGIPVSLSDAVTGLDHHNLSRLLTAICHASGKRPQTWPVSATPLVQRRPAPAAGLLRQHS